MSADIEAPRASALGRFGAELWERAAGALTRFPQRIRERRFWHIQALVLVATAPHYAIESSGEAFPSLEGWQLNSLAISLYILPLLYAALNYSWEGTVLTALWAAALISPSMWYWDRSGSHWATEMGQLVVVLPVGLLAAWRVGLEAEQRRRAETTSARLALLNEIGESLSQTLEAERQLPGVLRRVVAGLSLQSAWVCLEPESEGASLAVLVEVADPQVPPPIERAQRLHALIAARPDSPTAEEGTAVILLVGEGGLLGSLGAAVAEGESIADEQTELLTTIAHEIRVAVEHARLYRERQDALQSYVRQVTQAQEDERLRIARELHDETAQELVHLVRKLEQMGESGGATLEARVEELLGVARDTLRSVRRFSRDLRPPVLDDLGLLPALEAVVDEADSALAEGARLNVRGESRRLEGPVELALFRIAQEALRNVQEHSRGTSATVELEFNSRDIRLAVCDNGQGFRAPQSLPGLVRMGKLGLLGMKERAELIGGAFELESQAGQGTRVAVCVNGGEASS